jgi:Tol biopolymer transport system component
LIKANVGGSIYPLRISTNGAIYYVARDVLMDVYLAEVDFETGKVANPPKRATQRFLGINTRPIWSHDGRKLGFIRLSPNGATLADCFSVLELKTGEQRDFSLAGKFVSPIQGIAWSPDETFLLLRAYRTGGDDGIYRFDLQAGKAEPLPIQKRPQAGGDWYSNPRLSPDGKSFYYGRRRFFSEWKWTDSIYRRNLGTGQDELVYASAENLDIWGGCPGDVSPDGKELVIVTDDGKASKIVPVGRGDARTLVTVPPPVALSEPRWTRDGKRVVFLKAPKENVTELWCIAAAGDGATRLDLPLSPVCNFSLSPDGRQIALQAGPRQGPHGWITPEVWVLENALPPRVATAR